MVRPTSPSLVGGSRGIVVSLVAALLVGLVAGAGVGAWWMGRPGRRVLPDRVRTVTTLVSEDVTAIGVRHFGGFDISAAEGRECLVPLSKGQPIELGVVRTEPTDDADGVELVAWVRCLGPPRRG